MGTPIDELCLDELRLIVGAEEIDDALFRRLLKIRLEIMAPHLGKFTMDRVGDLWVGATNITRKQLRTINPPTRVGLGIETQGVFDWCRGDPNDQYGREYDEARPYIVHTFILHGWGFTRDGQWVSLSAERKVRTTVRSQVIAQDTVTSLSIKEVSLPFLLENAKVPAEVIWRVLASAAQRWQKRAEERLELAKNLTANLPAALELMGTARMWIADRHVKERNP